MAIIEQAGCLGDDTVAPTVPGSAVSPRIYSAPALERRRRDGEMHAFGEEQVRGSAQR
jgi:hypothetical protein